METGSPTAQLLQELHHAATRPTPARRRPILHHLNADTSWLLQLPRPASDADAEAGAVSSGPAQRRQRRREYVNLLIDPWLSGSQSDGAAWFSTQTHAIAPRVSSIKAVEALALAIEGDGVRDCLPSDGNAFTSPIDAVLISHEFTDHCHRATLLTVSPDVPIFAAPQAAKLVQSWKHFRNVWTVSSFEGNSSVADQAHRIGAGVTNFPCWIAIERIVNPGDALYYHSALLVSFDLSGADVVATRPDTDTEAIIYSPHGILPSALHSLGNARPTLRMLAFLHGLLDVKIPWMLQLNLGAYNGLEAQRVLKARYWIGTHDEVKKGSGLISWLLESKVPHVDETSRKDADGLAKMLDAGFLEVVNGATLVLA